MARSCLTIILAAGDGTRMRSQIPKVLHRVGGLPMVLHVLKSATAAGADSLVMVVGQKADSVRDAVRATTENVIFQEQKEKLGTAHAVLAAKAAIQGGYDDILVLFADTPLVRPETLLRMRSALAEGAEVAVLGFEASDPSGYGRLIVRRGELVAIREDKDASAEEMEISFCNGGIMAFRGEHAVEMLESIGNDNAKGEYYLTDLPAISHSRNRKVVALEAGEEEILGVNNRVELAKAEAIWQRRKREGFMLEGVSMIAPETVFLSHDTTIGRDCMIEPHVVFGPGVSLAENVSVRSFSHLEGCKIENDVSIGPYARIRPGTRMAQRSRVGNFCELKNADIGEGAKVNHLSYIGDAEIGQGANIGAGTITCNYDGVNKYRTEIGTGAFIGSNSALVAPVRIGDNAYVASGSVIVADVPAEAMAVARGRQVNKEGYAADIKRRNEAARKARSN